MKVLFIARHSGYLRNFDGVIRALAARGHSLRLAVERDDPSSIGIVKAIVADCPSVSVTTAPVRAREEQAERLRQLRLGIDATRFRDPLYNRARHLRARADARAPHAVLRWLDGPLVRRRPGRAALGALLRWVEQAVPVSTPIAAWLREEAPDVVLVTPVVELGSPQVDYLQAAQSLGLRTALPVTSWDHLSSKAPIRFAPDRVLVWNEIQRDEAIRLHGLDPASVVVTGAQAYDHWFDWKSRRSHAQLCAQLGLPPDRPFILYVCSSLFRDTVDETVFVEKWIRAIRASKDPAVRDAGILIRPHPARMEEWAGFDLSIYPGVTFWGSHPIDEASRSDYFDSMHHAAAVVGLNTSAFLEAAIVGRPVFTVILPKYSRTNQEGTIHFHYLLGGRARNRAGDETGPSAGTGLLHVARTFDEHVAQLQPPLATRVEHDDRSREFAGHFIRPFGLTSPATPRFVEAIEALAASPAPAPRGVVLPGLAVTVVPRVLREVGRRDKDAAPAGRVTVRGAAKRQAAAHAKLQAVGGRSALAPRVGKLREQKVLAGSQTPEAQAVREAVMRLAESGKPIIVGPWLSEAGFELLYWVPFVAWATRYAHLDPSRLFVVSRGGAAPWYQGVTANYDDAFAWFTPDEFRVRNDQRISDQKGVLKHVQLAGFDREIVERVASARGLTDYEVLHPSLMYGLFQLFWRQEQPVTLVELFTHYALILDTAAERAIRAALPDRYVVAKFYGGLGLPDTPDNRVFVDRCLVELTAQTDVVLLGSGIRYDDHDDFPRVTQGRLHTIDHLMQPASNLAVQTAVIRGADAYVGSYGGFSYLAPLVGTDAVTFYSDPSGFRWDHLEVAKRVFASLGGGGFSEVDVRHLRALHAAFTPAGRGGAPGL